MRGHAGSLPAEHPADLYSRCAYPRNRHGRGYCLAGSVTLLDDLLLPNIEDPDDLLTPDRLLVPDPLAWWHQPLPAGTSWLHGNYFARYACLGIAPFRQPLPDTLPEFVRGHLPREVRTVDFRRQDPLIHGIQNGASPGLQVAGVVSGATIHCIGLHPHLREFAVQIPAPPRMSVQTRWRAAESPPVALHHVELHPDDDVFTIVWRGTVAAPRALLPEELDALPVRVEWPA